MMYRSTDIKEIIGEILAKKQPDGGVDSVFYVGCGGSLGVMYPAKFFLERESLSLRTGWINSNEFVHSTPKTFGKNSIICLACHGGNTPETIAAARLGKEMGAAVILLTMKEESEITPYGDYVVRYAFSGTDEDMDFSMDKTMCALLVAVETLQQTEGYDNYEKFMDGVSRIDGIVKAAQTHVEKRAAAFGQEYRQDSFIYTMGSGASWASAYMESICIFMEMQWINSACIHTGEYFHGPFEVTDANIPFVVQVAEGSTRHLDERALNFLKRYAKRIEVLDAKELGLCTIDPAVVDYFNHSLFSNVYSVYNKALAEARQHPLSTRRYMWKVEY